MFHNVRPRCSTCRDRPPRPGQRTCRVCHAAYMRAHRPPLTAEARRKATVRWTANAYQRRGLLVRKPCQSCGDLFSEKHHPDYDQPLTVVWLCRPCHLAEH